MSRIFFCLFFWALFSQLALAEDMCQRFEGMWGPDYYKTYEEFPHMQPYMDGPSPDADSFVKGLIEARRIVIDCKKKTIQSIQGMMESEPRHFNIDSVNEEKMVINFIAKRFIEPRHELEHALAESLQKEAPRITFEHVGEFLYLRNPAHESFVMKPAVPFEPKK